MGTYMNKIIIAIGIVLFISGCSSMNTASPKITKIYPPSFLIQNCDRIAPYGITVKELILFQKETINNCNSQFSELRNWKKESSNEEVKNEKGP